MEIFLIYSAEETEIQGEPMYWSNQFGWTDLDNADIFDSKGKETLNLPFGDAIWKPIKKA